MRLRTLRTCGAIAPSMVLILAIVPTAHASAPASQPALDLIGSRVRQMTLGESSGARGIPETVTEDLAAMRADGSWPDVVYTDTDRYHWKAGDHLPRLESIVRAYYQQASVPAQVRQRIIASLDYWFDRDPHNVNWWHNEINVPREVGTILVMMGDDAPADLRARGIKVMMRANWSRQTGANLLDETWIQVMRGCISRSPGVIAQAFDRTWQELRIVDPQAEGIQADGSFHQHGPLLYSQSYGGVMLGDALRFLKVSAGTADAPPPAAMDALYRFVLDGDLWMSRRWIWDFGACGRAICRPDATRDSLQKSLDELAGYPGSRAAELASDATALQASDDSSLPVGNRAFWCSDYMVQRRADYFFSVRMYSKRTANTDELTNGENRQSQHIADGATCLMRSGSEYFNIYPAWDWHKIPGTTIEQDVPLLPRHIKRIGPTTFVGSVSDGSCGCAAMDLEYDALHARKAWFCFDRQIACLGCDIQCSSDNPVVTTLNQCVLHGPVYAAGETAPLPQADRALPRISWIWHDGVGYVLPEAANLNLKNGPQTGSWAAIGNGSTRPITGDVFTLTIDHGRRPTHASYQYLLLPEVDAQQTAAASQNPALQIISNTPALQAVWKPGANQLQAVFRQPGEVRCGDTVIRVDQSCLLMFNRNGNSADLAVASPDRTASSVNVWLSFAATGDATTAKNGGSLVTITLPNDLYAGATAIRHLKLLLG